LHQRSKVRQLYIVAKRPEQTVCAKLINCYEQYILTIAHYIIRSIGFAISK